MQINDKLGCHFLREALRCKDSLQRAITSSSVRNRTRLKQLTNITKKQVKEIQLIRSDTHPFFLPTDYDRDGRVKDCMSIVERTTPGVKFSAFEKHAGYLSQLGEPDREVEDGDLFSGRSLPAETYSQAVQTGQLSTLHENVIVSKSSLPFLSVAAESGYVLTHRICSPLTSVRDIHMTSPTHDSESIWKERSASCAVPASTTQYAEKLSALDVILY